MYKVFITILFFFLITLVEGQESKIRKLYVGTFTSEGAEGIYLCNFNTETGDISLSKVFKGIENPSFLRISPNKKYIYVASRVEKNVEPSGGYLNAYKIGEKGEITFLNKQISNGLEPCHVDVSKDCRFVATATYGGGTTSIYPVNNDGSLAPATTVNINQGSGPDRQRQEVPHAHSIKFSPYSNQVFSADLGTDHLDIYQLEGNRLVQGDQKFVKLASGAGPRHFEFHPEGDVIYVVSELNSTITALKNQNGKWTEFQVISTLPANFKGSSFAADIHISPDGRFLYSSNRGHNSIFICSIDKVSKKLTAVGTADVHGNWPRNFAITPDGRFLLVANQKSGNITVFKINSETGVPEFTGKEISLKSPVCLEFL